MKTSSQYFHCRLIIWIIILAQVLQFTEKKIQFALLFELEHIASNAREVEFDLLKSLLGEKGKNLQIATFARFCIATKPEYYLDDLLAHAVLE